MKLYYIHDPMCSWCYAFKPGFAEITRALRGRIKIEMLVAGLAPDSDEPMTEKMRQYLQTTWKKIESEVPGTNFNHNFWQQCQPRRSTYPACRAVLLARKKSLKHELAMIEGIQQAYYQLAKNPSNTETLIEIAENIGLEKTSFAANINSNRAQDELLEEVHFTRQLGARSFPSLLLKRDEQIISIPINYNNSTDMLTNILEAME